MSVKSTTTRSQDLLHHHKLQLESGLSRAEYCRQHNIDYKKLSGVAAKVSNTQPKVNDYANLASGDFIPVKVVSQTNSTTSRNEFSLTRSDGSSLTWVSCWSPEQVLSFVTAWRAHP